MTTVSGYGGTYAGWVAAEKARQSRKERRKKRKKKALTIVGKLRSYPSYQIELDFSDDGESFSNPLTSAKADHVYYVRATITQHVADPPWQGFKLRWDRPDYWYWYDGLGMTTYEETISNPLVIVRRVHSPARLQKVRFKTTVLDKYR